MLVGLLGCNRDSINCFVTSPVMEHVAGFAMKLVIAASDILAKDHRSVLRSNLCNSVTAYSCSMTQ